MHENGSKGKQTCKEKVNQKNKPDNSILSRLPDFLFDSAYQIVTWVCIGGCLAFFFYSLSRDSMRGAYWSGSFLIVFIVLMLALVGDRHFFQSRKGEPITKSKALTKHPY